MQRIQALELSSAKGKSKELLEMVQKKMGGTPNIFRTMAHAPAALEAYLNMSGAISGGSLAPQLREQIALAVAGVNACDYCASAHTAIGKGLGLSADQLRSSLRGEAGDARTKAALTFSRAIVERRGNLNDSDVAAVRTAGFNDQEIIEIIACVCLNLYTNYFNHIVNTDVDFPKVSARSS